MWYRVVQVHLETWLALAAAADATAPPAYVEQAFRRYIECGVLSCGFTRAFCKECGHDFVVAFSCHGRAVCPSCNARRMVETAAHLVVHVLPPLPLRQWVLSVPKRLRYFLHDDAVLQGALFTNSGSRGDISIAHRHIRAGERENGQIVRRRAARRG